MAHPTIPRRALAMLPAVLLSLTVVLAACGVNKDPQALPGKGLAKDYGCAACHTSDGAKGVGPTWKGLFGAEVTLQTGEKVTVDREYLVAAIKDPAKQVPEGTKVPMPVNRVPDADVQQIVDYIISLAG